MKNLNQNETKGETSRPEVQPAATSQSGLAKLGKATPKPRRHILLRLGPYSLLLGRGPGAVGCA